MNDAHAMIARAIDDYRPTAVALSHEIHERPELKFAEKFASNKLADAAQALGIDLERGICDLPTSFRGSFGSEGPTVAIMAEYDALPNGHSCGHNLIAGAALCAVAGLKVMDGRMAGRVMFLGTPAEEGGGGKILLLDRGALRGVDAAMMAHPADMEYRTMPALATHHLRIEFRGRAAHAALAPWDGASALAAVIQTFQSVDAMRLHLRDGSRLHGIISDGGQAVNIIPERTECMFLARAKSSKYAREIGDRVVRCAEAAAMATGTKCVVEVVGGYKNLINNLAMANRYAAHSEALGTPTPIAPDTISTGSTDMGDISHAMPAIHPAFAISSHGEGTCHEDAFVAHADSQRGYDAMIRVGKSMAMLAYDLIAEPELMKAAKEEFKRRHES
jgi:amidohydrolase